MQLGPNQYLSNKNIDSNCVNLFNNRFKRLVNYI